LSFLTVFAFPKASKIGLHAKILSSMLFSPAFLPPSALLYKSVKNFIANLVSDNIFIVELFLII